MAIRSTVASADVPLGGAPAGPGEVDVEVERLFALLGDPAALARMRPEVGAVEEIEPAPGDAAAYRVTEASRLGPLAFATEQRVALVSIDPDGDALRVVTRRERAIGERTWVETTALLGEDSARVVIAATVSAPGPLLDRAVRRAEREAADVLAGLGGVPVAGEGADPGTDADPDADAGDQDAAPDDAVTPPRSA